CDWGPCGVHLQRAEGAFRPARRQRPRRGLEQVPLSRMARFGGRWSSARLPRDRRASPELAHPVAKASQARRNSSRYYLQIRRLPVVRESGHTFAFGNKVYIINLIFSSARGGPQGRHPGRAADEIELLALADEMIE